MTNLSDWSENMTGSQFSQREKTRPGHHRPRIWQFDMP